MGISLGKTSQVVECISIVDAENVAAYINEISSKLEGTSAKVRFQPDYSQNTIIRGIKTFEEFRVLLPYLQASYDYIAEEVMK